MGSGRKKIAITKIDNLQYRRVTFTKRRQGIFKKADQLSSLTGCRVAALFFSPSMNPFVYGDLSLLQQAGAAAAGSTSPFRNNSIAQTINPNDSFATGSPNASVGDNLGHRCDQGGCDDAAEVWDQDLAKIDDDEDVGDFSCCGGLNTNTTDHKNVVQQFLPWVVEECRSDYHNNVSGEMIQVASSSRRTDITTNNDEELLKLLSSNVDDVDDLSGLMLMMQKLEAAKEGMLNIHNNNACGEMLQVASSSRNDTKNDGLKLNDELLHLLSSCADDVDDLGELMLRKQRLEAAKEAMLDRFMTDWSESSVDMISELFSDEPFVLQPGFEQQINQQQQ